jgi:hypothetical protein
VQIVNTFILLLLYFCSSIEEGAVRVSMISFFHMSGTRGLRYPIEPIKPLVVSTCIPSSHDGHLYWIADLDTWKAVVAAANTDSVQVGQPVCRAMIGRSKHFRSIGSMVHFMSCCKIDTQDDGQAHLE